MVLPERGTGVPGAERPGDEGVSVGVVIPLPEPLRSQLREERASLGDPVAGSIPPHITLVTGAVATDWVAVREHVRNVAARAGCFRLSLRGTASFRPVTNVVFLQVEDGFDECVSLHRALQAGPLSPTAEFDFHPHLTIAHDLPQRQLDLALERLEGYAAEFPVDRIGLFEHDADGLWALQEELILGQARQTHN
ncbi:2'-5' RNA ligase family protein [Arthrobacter sp. JSM 101049]|uniref:2'-5' RNA ligase family protein n=1 Tax=Arthrobacter sp. JSM 101049 TaxID=929097 RepID=UPI003565AD43